LTIEGRTDRSTNDRPTTDLSSWKSFSGRNLNLSNRSSDTLLVWF